MGTVARHEATTTTWNCLQITTICRHMKFVKYDIGSLASKPISFPDARNRKLLEQPVSALSLELANNAMQVESTACLPPVLTQRLAPQAMNAPGLRACEIART